MGVSMAEKVVSVNTIEQVQALFGKYDENVNMLQKQYGVSILGRGGDIKITGADENVENAKKAIEILLSLSRK